MSINLVNGPLRGCEQIKLNEETEEMARKYESLGELKIVSEDYAGAIDDFHKALKIYTAIYGDIHDSLARQYELIGEAHYLCGAKLYSSQFTRGVVKSEDEIHLQNCIDSYFKAIDTLVRLYGKEQAKNHERIAKCYINISLAYECFDRETGDFSDTVFYIKKGLAIYSSLYGESSEKVIECRERMKTPKIKGFIDSHCHDKEKCIII